MGLYPASTSANATIMKFSSPEHSVSYVSIKAKKPFGKL